MKRFRNFLIYLIGLINGYLLPDMYFTGNYIAFMGLIIVLVALIIITVINELEKDNEII
jgi:hypothetical protein